MKSKEPQKERKPWLLFFITFADDFAIIGVIVLLVLIFDVQLPVWAWILAGVAALAVIIIVHKLMFTALSRKNHMGKETMAGKRATVTEPCCPAGMVIIEGEYWRATSIEGSIDEGEEVEIVTVRGLRLEVRRISG